MAIPQLLMKRDEDQSEAQSKRRIDDESYCQSQVIMHGGWLPGFTFHGD
jgi:hypothetical protein